MKTKRTLTKRGRPAFIDNKAPDERVRRSKATVLGVAAELLFERGFAGVSVDEITRRSGVAKTTIYRHWATRSLLMRDACLMIGTPLDIPDTGSFKADAMALMKNLANMLRSAKWTSVLPSILDAAERDPEIADLYSRLQESYSEPIQTVLQRAVGRGELPKTIDAAVMIAALTGPLFYRRWFSREPLTEAFVTQIVLRAIARKSKGPCY